MKWLLLSKGHKPDNFESHNALKLSSTNIWGLCSNFFEFESFLQSNSFDIHFMWEKLGWFSWFWQFLCEGLTSFNLKDSITHRHDLAVHVKEELFSRDLSLENSVDSYLCFWLALLHLGSYFFFPLYQWPSLSLCMVMLFRLI